MIKRRNVNEIISVSNGVSEWVSKQVNVLEVWCKVSQRVVFYVYLSHISKENDEIVK